MYVHPFKFTTSCIFKTFLFSYLITFLSIFHSLINWKLNIYLNFYWHNRQTDTGRLTSIPFFSTRTLGTSRPWRTFTSSSLFSFLSPSLFLFFEEKLDHFHQSHLYKRSPFISQIYTKGSRSSGPLYQSCSQLFSLAF